MKKRVYVFLLFFCVLQMPFSAFAGRESGGGDPKAIEFLSYAQSVCKWMATDGRVNSFSQKCSDNVADIYDSLGNYKRTARLQFVPDQLKDAQGVNKPAVTSTDGNVAVNLGSWVNMPVGDRVRLVAMEMSVICSIGDRYNLGDLFGGVWNLEHGDRAAKEIPVGTKLLSYSPIVLPARSNAIGFFDKTTTISSSFKEITTTEDSYTEVDVQSTNITVEDGHMYGLGNVTAYGKNGTWFDMSNGCGSGYYFGFTNEAGDHSYSSRWRENDMPDHGFIILTPQTYENDMELQSLTITGLESEQVEEGTYSLVVLTAVTDANPNNVIKIIGFRQLEGVCGEPELSLRDFANAFQRHFAIIFPQPQEL